MTRRIAILGSTGSIGNQTLDVIREFPQEFEVVGLSAHSSVESLQSQIQEFQPEKIAITGESPEQTSLSGVKIVSGLSELISPDLDLIVLAVVGAAGLRPCLKALEQDVHVALANKEVLVVAGELIKESEKQSEAKLIPVDSEHSALFQVLQGESSESIKKVTITASGGPFRTWSQQQIESVTLEEALNHPNWDMGPKITIDSATMMNKGLEIIEACYLFDLEPDQVGALVHPQSIVHGLVEYQDHSIIAQCAPPDMKLPIQFALFYPDRRSPVIESLSMDESFCWEFEPVDRNRFPAYGLALKSLEAGGSYPAVLNAANEMAVRAFLREQIEFLDIPRFVEEALSAHDDRSSGALEELLEVDRWARSFVREKINTQVTNP